MYNRSLYPYVRIYNRLPQAIVDLATVKEVQSKLTHLARMRAMEGQDGWRNSFQDLQDLVDMLYLDEETKAWAEANQASDDDYPPAKDSNGAVLNAGDTVTLIKDLDVKGAGFTAKRGTAVRGISLTSNPDQIEGRVNGTRIVLLTKFLKKQS